jgi:translocation and assembly module TamB
MGATISIKNNQVDGVLNLIFNDNGKINGDFRLANITDDDSLVDATLKIDISDLSPYATLIPSIEIPGGTLTGELTLANRLKKPSIKTLLDINIPIMHVYPLNTEWQDLSLNLRSSDINQFTVNATMKAGEGQLAIDGEISGTETDGWQSQLKVTGNNALLANNANQRLVANPDLNIEASLALVSITGELLIPEAALSFKAQPSRLNMTKDAIIHNLPAEETNEKQKREPDLLIDIVIKLGDEVTFLAYGLDTNINGELSLRKRVDENILGQGELQLVDGTYKAYGQDLQIERGLLQFTGNIMQPTVDLNAFRQVGNVKAGIEVTGPVDKLRSRLYSEPTLTDAEILSYLIRGKALNEMNETDQGYLSNAALSYAVNRSTPVSETISELFDLDEASITVDQGIESLGFTLGKYLTPDLYVRYGYGIVDKLNKLFTQYRLTNHLYLESEVGEGQSIDLIYKSK